MRDQLVVNNDFAPTFAEWAEIRTPRFVDGRSLAPLLDPTPPAEWRTAILNERHPTQRNGIPRYEAIRTKHYTYVEWETGERELYDLREDPYQLHSIHETADPSLIANLKTRLEALRGCAGAECRAAEEQ